MENGSFTSIPLFGFYLIFKILNSDASPIFRWNY